MNRIAWLAIGCALAAGAGTAAAQQSQKLTTTADFMRGHNEGMISTDGDQLTRERIVAGPVTAWDPSSALNIGRSRHGTAHCNGFAYVAGGLIGLNDPVNTTSVEFAPLNSDGSIGAWALTTVLDVPRWNLACVASNGFLYSVGGHANIDGTVFTSADVLVAPLNADGTVGSWTPTTALPSGRRNHAAVIWNGYLYVVGGFTTASTTEVLYAPLNADGSVGAWSFATPLPSGRNGLSIAAYNGFLYSLGGATTGATRTNEVLVAPLNSDGTVGDWTAITALPAARSFHSANAHDGFLYAAGGLPAPDEVHMAPINSDGTIGEWASTTALPALRNQHGSFTFRGRLYLLGGLEVLTFQTVPLVATLDPDMANGNQTPGLLRGFHSQVVDLLADAVDPHVLLKGQASPGGSVHLQVRFAPAATGVFGSETVLSFVPLGTAVQLTGTGRYLWIRVTLDDTATGDVDQPTVVTEISVGRLPTVGEVFDGAGADLDSQRAPKPIAANWTGFTAPTGESIVAYEWAIGSAPGLSDLQGWINVGAAIAATNTGLAGQLGMKFISVRAMSAAGLVSPPATSDGIEILPPLPAQTGDDGDSKNRCGQSASGAPGLAAAGLAGFVLLAAVGRRRRWNLLAGFVAACGVAAAAVDAESRQSVSITTTADFQKGNDEGLGVPAQDRVSRERIGAGTLGAWANTAELPTANSRHGCAAYNGFVYATGGMVGQYDVVFAPLNADGSTGAWTATTPLPMPLQEHTSVAWNGYLYAIGGFSGGGEVADVFVAPLNADGTVGNWTATASLPSATTAHASAAYNGFLYVLGGSAEDITRPDVLVAPVDADGTVGAWTATSALPAGLNRLSAVAWNGFLYALGGQGDDFFPVATVSMAPLNADGTVGAWAATTEFPYGRSFFTVSAEGGFLYAVGGVDAFTEVHAAPINPDGTVGAWSLTTELSSSRLGHGAVAYNGYLFIVGGVFIVFHSAEVLVAPIDADTADANQAPDRLRGFQSYLVDLQGGLSNLAVRLAGELSPGGQVRLQIRVADATGTFGPETVVEPAPLGESIPISGAGRYVWIRLGLDDTATTDVDSPTFVSEIAVGAAPSPGEVFDGPGADIDSQTSKSTIEANWTGFAPAGADPVAFHEWAIGSAPGLSNIQDWTNVGLATSASSTGLSLGPGPKFVSVRATSVTGLTSPAATSDGVNVVSASATTSGDDGDSKRRCGNGATGEAGAGLAILGGVLLLVAARRGRQWLPVVVLAFPGIASAQETVVVTSTADFRAGNDEGLILPDLDQVSRHAIDAGTVGAWSPTTSLPEGRVTHASFAHNGYLYVMGGGDEAFTGTAGVSYAPLNADGTVGSWSPGTSLPVARSSLSAVAYNGRVYILGGLDPQSEFPTDVLVAPLNADGSIGSWSGTSPIPSGRGNPTAVAYNGFLYLLGGLSAEETFDDVLVAAINADGSLGAWTPTTSLPTPLSAHASVVRNGFIYVIGGSPDSGFSFVADVRYAPLNPDGTVGGWTSTSEILSPRAYLSSFAHGGFVHVNGGFDATFGFVDEHLVAPLNPDGSLGAWTPSTNLVSGRVWHTSVAYGEFAYAIGGFNPSFEVEDDVRVAPIEADVAGLNQAPARLRGAWSRLVDLGTDVPTRYVTIKGQPSPGGVLRLQARVAPDATGIFGAETVVDAASPGVAVEIPGAGRYVWLRVTLDDTGTTNPSQATAITEIAVGETPPPTPGTVLDGSGADIDTQTSTTTIRANWSGFTAGAGDTIAFYEWSIGTAPGLGNLQGWVNVGSSTSATNSSLSLSTGMKFVSVRATGASGLTSPPATSDGVQVLPGAAGATGGDDDDDDGRCSLDAGSVPGSIRGLLAGFLLLAGLCRRARGA